ncbi:MAG: adenylyltransferase/cytidyltransferase family protein [Candidatus Daviesbacteria bacterium]|nr:adenylyltransferase/cytidyltransferase family protein [Candidatus Daviesbacteria bacterium]MDP3948253.1 adenylyltransferase/cytidyltransferase family protein [bacterium]
MGKVVTFRKLAPVINKIKNQAQKSVLVGGCFDVLHPGHVIFLEKAKKKGDILIVLLEADEKVAELKGLNRPIHTQAMRAKVLSALQAVDYVVMLPFLKSESAYDGLIRKIKPNVIALTSGYKEAYHHKRAAKLTGAKLKYVAKLVNGHSTSRILGCSYEN